VHPGHRPAGCDQRGEVIPGIEARRIPGFRSFDLVRREREPDVEFMTLMWFDTLDSVRAFMGEDYEAAHVPPSAQEVLADFDRRSAHYTDQSFGRSAGGHVGDQAADHIGGSARVSQEQY
jgi:heme-degrading monooxygenase HmoA